MHKRQAALLFALLALLAACQAPTSKAKPEDNPLKLEPSGY